MLQTVSAWTDRQAAAALLARSQQLSEIVQRELAQVPQDTRAWYLENLGENLRKLIEKLQAILQA